ncbi:MAG: phosphonate ABC transporter, permease protein PhnE [Hyphomicrobiales bacterium]|nr:phosphonate ABC transporter, permease protein PhnE [Hyphomicrobiales bacterium]
MSGLRETALADIGKITERHPKLMGPSLIARLPMFLVVAVAIVTLIFGFATLDVSWRRVFNGFGELGKIASLMLPPDYGTPARLMTWTQSLLETLAIAFLGTLLAAIVAFPLGFLVARNVVPSWIFRFSLRRGLDGLRGIDTLIWALIWINVVGLGPFAGVLAIMTSDIGGFGKLFSEAIEAADDKPGEGVISTGGSDFHRIVFGLIPQVMPVLLSQVLYYFESNTRSATIIGIVGAGGIGLHLSEQIRTLEWQHVSFIVLMILVTVAIIDTVSARIRFAIIGGQDPGAQK